LRRNAAVILATALTKAWPTTACVASPLIGRKKGSLRGIDLPQIDRALVELVTQGSYARATVQLVASHLRSFFRYAEANDWCCLGLADGIKAPRVFAQGSLPAGPSWDDVRRLLATAEGDRPTDRNDATDSFQRQRSVMEPVTVRTIVLLLYGTGLRVGEAVRLNRTDVDMDNSLLTVHLTKFHKTRLVPFGPQVCRALAKYAQSRRPLVVRPREDGPFFTTRSGNRVKRDALERNFQRLRAQAGIRRSDGARYQPRLHDLRHTFAVHRLTSWYQQRANVQKLLHQLSVYLGHALLASTQVYLTMTPELLQQASARFERYAGKDGGHD